MQLLVKYALTLVGLPYIWGGDDAIKGFDCSGLVQELLASVGMDPPGDQTSKALYDYFDTYGQKIQAPQTGALVFYGKNRVSHVAMALDHFRVIEAGGGGSSTIDRASAVRQNAYVRIRPWNRRKDIIGIYLPDYKKKSNLFAG